MADDCPPWQLTMPDGAIVKEPPRKWLDAWNARIRAELGKPPLPDTSHMPEDMRRFVEMM
jgi:hypothetical protein